CAFFAGMLTAQENRMIRHGLLDRPDIVAERPVETLAGMRIREPEAAQRGGRRYGACRARHRKPTGRHRQKQPPIHRISCNATEPPCPALCRVPTSFFPLFEGGFKTWVAGTSPATGQFGSR